MIRLKPVGISAGNEVQSKEFLSATGIMSIDVEDYFHVSAFSSMIHPSQWDQFESRVESSTLKILSLLSKKQVRGTFFVLGWVAERHRRLIKTVQSEGHEIACHGHSHELVYKQTPEAFREETAHAKSLLEDITGNPVVSYRAASYSITRKSLWALRILAELGFKYDSSIFPIRHDRYGIPDAPRGPFVIRLADELSIVEFPLSTVRWFGVNLPIAGGGYFRLIPYACLRAAARKLCRTEGLPFVFYLHPWEFDPDQPVQQVGRVSRFRHYLNLKKTEGRFSRLLQDFRFEPLATVAQSMTFPEFNFGAHLYY